jgi:exopolysaccharide biosynthesis polyprenyl glycosylphosphotransferase
VTEGVAWTEPPEITSDETIAKYERVAAAGKQKRGWLVRRALVAADLIGLVTAFTLSQILYAHTSSGHVGVRAETILFVLSLPGWVVIARLYGLYSQDEQQTNHLTTDEAAHAFHMVTVCTWILFAFTWLSGVAHPAVPKLVLFWGLAAIAVPVARASARAYARTRPAYLQNTVIIGAGDVGQSVAEKLLRHPEYGVNLLGFIDDEPTELRKPVDGLPFLGPPEALSSIIGVLGVERVIIAFPQDPNDEVLGRIRDLKDSFVQVDIVPGYYELIGSSTRVSSIEGVPVLCLPPRALGVSAQYLKRVMDVVVSIVALLLLLPVFLMIAAIIYLDSPGPVFFRQRRIGAHDRSFRIFKFRTMVMDAEERKEVVAHMNKHRDGDERMFKIPSDPRTTRVGGFLRRFSLDELPQLINVLKGDMSLVGPRPLIPSEDEHVADWGRTRLDLRPGMTGLWQVLGRSEIPFEEMVRLDYVYVTNWSLWHDLRLMCGTVPAMLRGGRGAY